MDAYHVIDVSDVEARSGIVRALGTDPSRCFGAGSNSRGLRQCSAMTPEIAGQPAAVTYRRKVR